MNSRSRQRGVTLVVSLVMLFVLTLLVMAGIRLSTSNLRIAGNMQTRAEVSAAASQAIEQTISSNFTASPAASTVTVALNDVTYTAQVATPSCSKTRPVLNTELDATNALDAPCFTSGAMPTGPLGPTGRTTAMSWCDKQLWDVQATVNDANSGASTTQHQGVSMRVQAGTSC